jgi:hypothetical protein
MSAPAKSGRSDLLLNSSILSFAAGGVCLFAAKRNRKKALAATVGQAPSPRPLPGKLMTQSVPTAGLKITF